MCRLYADKGKKESEVMDLLVGFRFKREDAEILEREVREHREWQRKHGYDVLGGEYTEKDLIRYAVNRYIEELREKEQEKMRKTEEMREELGMMPELFRKMHRLGRWSTAIRIYERVVKISGVLGMEQEERDKILGEFNPVQVEDAYQKAGWREDKIGDAIRKSERKEALYEG